MKSRWVAGVDGCVGGWVVVLHDLVDDTYLAVVERTFHGVLARSEAAAVIAVDVPIGLLDSSVVGGRNCDKLARRALGGRACCVFSPPTRAALASAERGIEFAVVSDANRGDNPSGPRLSKQAFAILDKIREVDGALCPELQEVVYEVHPELSFAEANGGSPVTPGKKHRVGRSERVALLERLGVRRPLALFGSRVPAGVRVDDILDACIACWTARRIVNGTARVVPRSPVHDARGLRMGIWC